MNQRLTDRNSASGVSETDLIHVVIQNDHTQSPEGSSYKVEMGRYKNVFPNNFITGGTYSNGSLNLVNNTGGTFSVSGQPIGNLLGSGTPTYIPKFNTSSTINDSIMRQNSSNEITVNGIVTASGLTISPPTSSNFTPVIINMPMVDNFPIGGVPDAVRIYTNGTNGITASRVSGVYVVMNGNRNVGFNATSTFGDLTGLTNTNAFEATFVGNSNNNYGFIINRGNYNIPFYVTEDGVSYLSGTSSANAFIKHGGTNVQYLMADGSISYGNSGGTDTFVTGGTYSSGTATFTNNTGGTFSVTGFSTSGGTSGGTSYWSGGTGTNAIATINGNNIASGDYSVAQGLNTTASGDYGSHTEGNQTIASGNYGSHAEGYQTIASGPSSHAEGTYTQASGFSSHAEGSNTIALGDYSHAEGNQTIALGVYSHAGGVQSIANGISSFVHGSMSTVNGNYSIVLGRNITGNTADTTYVDNLNIRTVGFGPGVTDLGVDINGFVVNQASDRRLKENINTIDGALDKVMNLRGVTYNWVDRETGGDGLRHGFIAQEVQEVLPDLVTENGEYLGVQYKDVPALLVEAIKELTNKVKELENIITDLKNK